MCYKLCNLLHTHSYTHACTWTPHTSHTRRHAQTHTHTLTHTNTHKHARKIACVISLHSLELLYMHVIYSHVSMHGFTHYTSLYYCTIYLLRYLFSFLDFCSTIFSSHFTMPLLYRKAAKAAALLVPLLGINWMVGFLNFSASLLISEYLFSIVNSLQVCLLYKRCLF